MRGPFDSMLRWWRVGETEDNGQSRNGESQSPIFQSVPPPHEDHALDEMPWLAQLDKEGIPRTLRYPSTTLGRIVDQAAGRFPDNPALIYNHEPWTYRELLLRINRLAGGLAQMGVRTGDRVVLTLPNCPEFVLAFFAVQKLGAVVVNAGPLMGVDDLKHVMELTKPRVVIGLDLLARKIIDASTAHPPEHFIWVSLQVYQSLIRRMGYQLKLWQNRERPGSPPVKHTSLHKLLETAPARPPTIEPAPAALALLQPTSGTTGMVKLVELSHANLLANATQVLAWMSVRDGQESVLAVLPMFHVFGLMMGLISPICCCATIIPTTRFDADEVLRLIIQYRPGIFPLVPAICDALSNTIEKQEHKPILPPVRICTTGAAPLPREVAERFQKLTGIRVVEGYGLSESSPVTHANFANHPRYGSIGLPMPDTHCQLVDLEEGIHPVAPGQPGELVVSGPQVMSGYYGNPEATRRALWTDEQGRVWLRTGDIARMDEDGYFQILDRKKDMIIRSGLKVYPAKVEKVLAGHPRVSDVAVVGQSDPIHSEEVVAVIVLKPDGKELMDRSALVSELRLLCREHLAPYEVPQRFIFKPQIPRSALGKVLKASLRQQLGDEITDEPPRPNPDPVEKEAA
jgi:long-chain acyl-CoA synthetase